MKKRIRLFSLLSLTSLFAISGVLYFQFIQNPSERRKQSGAGLAMDAWSAARSYPNHQPDIQDFSASFIKQKNAQTHSGKSANQWQPLGPWNVGGRTLCLAFDPEDEQTVFAGSASGGLWRSKTGGKGKQAWEYIRTGFPVLSVSALAIAPGEPNTIYLGTGEVYNYRNSFPGVANRVTRGSYGIGILKSTDGGESWEKSLDWSFGDMRGIQKIVLNPLNANTVYAATSEGLYRSQDAGKSWTLLHDIPMAVDIEIHPSDTSTIYVTHGNLNSLSSGIFKSTDNGRHFYRLLKGLPVSYSGKCMLAISPSDPNILYASIGNALISDGLYRSNDQGENWELINDEDVAKWQGWYSHDVAVDPQDPNTIIYVGIDAWKSKDGGKTLKKESDWRGKGGKNFEPHPKYIHADIHAIYFHPSNPNWVYYACDGGVFKSEDKGETFIDCNHGYQTSQFYANFSNSSSNPNFAMGGMQDNSSVIYKGKKEWWRVLGGDGLSTAINPQNDRIIYGSYQYLNMMRSRNGGHRWEPVTPPFEKGENPDEITNFAGPFELAPSDPRVMYAGRNYLYRSTNYGTSWKPTTNTPLNGRNPILTIAVGPQNPNVLYIGTSALDEPPVKIMKSENGGSQWTDLSHTMPERLPMDIAIDPSNDQIAYIAFSGFDNSHICKSTDGGKSWFTMDNGLPNVPTSTVLIDPQNPQHVYVGNDLGVYLSKDAGNSWTSYTAGLPEAVMVMHLSDSPSNRKIRLASHGHGVWEVDYAGEF